MGEATVDMRAALGEADSRSGSAGRRMSDEKSPGTSSRVSAPPAVLTEASPTVSVSLTGRVGTEEEATMTGSSTGGSWKVEDSLTSTTAWTARSEVSTTASMTASTQSTTAFTAASRVMRAGGGLLAAKELLSTGDSTDTGACLTGELTLPNDKS